MPAVAHTTWYDSFEVFLPLFSSDSVTSEELARKELVSLNNQHVLLSLPSEN